MKILIINENRHNSIGGIEKYTNSLIDIFSKNNYEVHEYAFNLSPERIDMFARNEKAIALNIESKTDKPLSIREKQIKIKKCVSEIKKIYTQYDLIINNTSNIKWFKEFYDCDKVVYVQHFNPNFYKQKYIAGKLLAPIIYFGMNLVGIKNPFKKFKNFVVFSQEDATKLKLKNNYSIIPIAVANKKILDENKTKINDNREGLVFVGRLDSKQKEIKKMISFAKSNKIKLSIYGAGDTSLIKDSEYIEYKGMLDNKKIYDTLNQYKYFITFSKYEGLPTTIIESLSIGLPVIINNFCPSAKNISDQKGFFIDKNNAKKIMNLDIDNNLYTNMVNNCLKYSYMHFLFEDFEKNWINIVRRFGR